MLIFTLLFLLLESNAVPTPFVGDTLSSIASFLDFESVQTLRKTIAYSNIPETFSHADIKKLSPYRFHSANAEQEALSRILDITDPAVQRQRLSELMSNQNHDLQGNHLVKTDFSNNFFIRQAAREHKTELLEYFLNPSAKWAKRLNLGINRNYLLKDAAASGDLGYFKLILGRFNPEPTMAELHDLEWAYALAKAKGHDDVQKLILSKYPRVSQEGTLVHMVNEVMDSNEPTRRFDLDLLLRHFPKQTNDLANTGRSILIQAAESGKNDLVKMFLKHGWDPNGNQYAQPLAAAISHGNVDTVKLLLNAEKLNLVDIPNARPRLSHSQISKGILNSVPQNMDIAELLINSNKFDPFLDSNKLLNLAVLRKNYKLYQALIENPKVQAAKKRAPSTNLGRLPPRKRFRAESPESVNRDRAFFNI